MSTQLIVRRSHWRICESPDALSSSTPPGNESRQETYDEWPRIAPLTRPVRRSSSRIVLSMEPTSMDRSSNGCIVKMYRCPPGAPSVSTEPCTAHAPSKSIV